MVGATITLGPGWLMSDCILIFKEDKLLKTVSIGDHVAVSIGRHKLNDLHLPDPSSKVSRFHAALFRDAEGRYSLQDLGSRNHTYVNGKRRDYGTLNDGDRIQIGEYTLVFQKQAEKSRPEKSAVAVVDGGADDYAKTVLVPAPSPSEDVQRLKDDPDGLLLLYQLSRVANLGPDLEESLPAIVDELARTFHPNRVFIALLEQNRVSLTCLARFPIEDTEIRFSRTMLQHLLQEKQVLITEDALADERFQKQGKPAKSVLEQQIRSAVCVPLQWSGEIKGMLYLDSTQEDGRFTARDIKLLDLIGQDLSLLLERALDYSAVRDEKLRLENQLAIESTIIGISPKTKAVLKRWRSLLPPMPPF